MLVWMSITTGLSIAEAAEISGVSAHTPRYYERAGDDNLEARLALLQQHRAAVRPQLEEVRGHLTFIDRKIATYEERING